MEMSRNELEALIVQRAWKDDAFRSEFLGDPKATIEKYSGQKLPADARIVAHAEDDHTVHFVIPQKPANADELSDEDLEKVAGGVEVVGIAIAVGFWAGAGVLVGGALGGAAAGAAVGTKQNHGW